MPITRVSSLLVLSAALILVGCTDSDSDEGDARGNDGSGAAVGDVSWDLPYDEDDITVCGDIVVRGSLGETPQVVGADGSVVEIDDAPPQTEVDLTDDPNTRAHCLLDDAGEPVVVVEWQAKYFDSDVPATVYVGHDVDGAELWTHAGPLDATAAYGRGALSIGADDSDSWVVLDARSGEVLADRTFERTPRPVTSTLLALDGTGLVDLDGGTAVPLEGDLTQVDAERVLVEDRDGTLSLVDVASAQVSWTVPDGASDLLEILVDLSTDVAVLVRDDQLVGVDLATGETAWTSEAEPGLFGANRVGAGVAVLPDDRFTSQQLVDTATGAVLPERDDYVLAGNDLLVAVSDGRVTLTTVAELR